MRTDTDVLTQQIDGTIETFDTVLDAAHTGEPYDDGSGIGQDPMVALDNLVHEVTTFRSVRLLLSGGGPRVVAEAEIDSNGEIVRPGAERRTGGDDDAVIDDPEYGAARTDRSHQQPDEGR